MAELQQSLHLAKVELYARLTERSLPNEESVPGLRIQNHYFPSLKLFPTHVRTVYKANAR